MRCEQLVLPPGSLAVCLGHAAHAVSPKAADRPPRLASSHFYKKRNDVTGFAQPADDLPPLWGRKAARGELPAVMAELFRNAFDGELTGGRTSMLQWYRPGGDV